MKSNQLPVIDWTLATQLASNDRAFAEQLLEILIKNLKLDAVNIQAAYMQKDHVALARHLHKLYGALCYCGATRLKQAVSELQQGLRENADIPALYATVEKEIEALLKHSS